MQLLLSEKQTKAYLELKRIAVSYKNIPLQHEPNMRLLGIKGTEDDIGLSHGTGLLSTLFRDEE